jgi:hypothetical protein
LSCERIKRGKNKNAAVSDLIINAVFTCCIYRQYLLKSCLKNAYFMEAIISSA